MEAPLSPKQKALNAIIKICHDKNALAKSILEKPQIYESQKRRFEARHEELNFKLNEQFEKLQNIFDAHNEQKSLF
jgi:hypothetical protein